MTSESEESIQRYWDRWNSTFRESGQDEQAQRQARVIAGWVEDIGRRDLSILEVGCGAGWFASQLARYGKVTGVDLAHDVLERAAERAPTATFLSGDFMQIHFEPESFDVVVHLEVLSHVADQAAFADKVASLVRPGGQVLLATQNREVREKYCSTPADPPQQIRAWVDRDELRRLIEPKLAIDDLLTVTPEAHHGPRRLLTSRKVNRLLGKRIGAGVDRVTERLGWGRTIMLRGHKPTVAQ